MRHYVSYKKEANVMLLAILIMIIMTGVTVVNYHYLAMQRQVDQQLINCFLKQAEQRMKCNHQDQFKKEND